MIKNNLQKFIAENKISEQELIWLLEHICQEKYLTLSTKDLTSDQENLLHHYLHQITVEHKPLAYILGWVPFLNLTINVHPPILIPRPETEEWVDRLITELSPHRDKILNILDIGTGSGVIALSLAASFPHAQVIAIDINPEALALAQENANLNKIKNIKFIQSDLFTKLKDQKFDLIVSNPPYIPALMKDSLSPSVTQWEDDKALFSGETGLDIIKTILEQTSDYLTDNPALPFQLVVEIDISQDTEIQKLSQNNNLYCSVKKDLFGNSRTIWCSKNI